MIDPTRHGRNATAILRSALVLAAALLAGGLGVPCALAQTGDVSPAPGGGSILDGVIDGGMNPGLHCPVPSGDPCDGSGPASIGTGSGANLGAGNPIHLASGNKYRREVDLPALPGVLGLEIVRHYNSTLAGPRLPIGILGRGWRLSYETELAVFEQAIHILQADGSRVFFARTGKGTLVAHDPAYGQLHVRGAAARPEGFEWHWPDGRRLDFDGRGRLQQIVAPDGHFVSILRAPDGSLLRVTDPQGRTLVFEYAVRNAPGFRGVVAITSPVGRFVLAHQNDRSEPGLSNLVAVENPEGGVRRYHYGADEEEFAPHLPHHLTGISVDVADAVDAASPRSSRRIATYGYDSRGRATLSVRGVPQRTDVNGQPVAGTGIEQVNVEYPERGVTVVTNSVGERTTYRHTVINSAFRLLEAIGPGCASCGPTNRRYAYDALGRMVEDIALGAYGAPVSATLFAYDARGRLASRAQRHYLDGALGEARLIARYEYADASPRPVLVARPSVVPGREHQVAFAYNDAGQILRVTESGFSPLDETGEVAISPEAVTPLSRTTTYTYTTINRRSLLAAIDGPLANGTQASPEDSDITLFEWDAGGNRIVSVTHPMGLVETLEYALAGANPSGLLTARTDVNGVRTDIQWAEGAVRIASVHRAGIALSFDYDPLGRPRAMSRNDGARIEVEHDDANARVRYRLPDGEMREFDLDTEGRPVTERWFDAEQRVLLDRQRIEYGASTSGTPEVQLTDAAGVLTRLRVDPVSGERVIERGHGAARLQQTERFDPVQHLLRIERNEAVTEVRGSPDQAERSLRLPHGATHRFWRDDFGRTVRIEHPDSGVHLASYDEADRLTVRRDPLRVTSARYDALGRLIQLRHAQDGSGSIIARAVTEPEELVQWHYRGALLVQHTSNRQDKRFAYDANARLIETGLRLHRQETDSNGVGRADALSNDAWLPELVTGYRRDELGRIARVELPEAATLTQHYNSHGLIDTVLLQPPASRWWQALVRRFAPEHGTQILVSRIEHRSSRGLEGYQHANGHLAQGRHDAAGRLIEWHDGPLLTGLGYNEHAQLHSLRTKAPAGVGAGATPGVREQVLSYDPFGRLRTVRDAQGAQGFNYDPNGNRLHTLLDTRPHLLSRLAEHSDQLLAIEDDAGTPQRRYHYNGAGEPVRIDDLTHSGGRRQRIVHYDAMGQIGRIEQDERLLARYAYNSLRQRVARSVFDTSGDSQTTYYTWHRGLVDAELDERGRVARRYFYVNLRPVALLDYDYADARKAHPDATRTFAIHTDHLGTPHVVTDKARRVLWTARYDAFGGAQAKTLPSAQVMARPASRGSWIGTAHTTPPSPAFAFNLRFAGQHEDPETGWHYNWHRYYDPETGRYLTPDPIGLSGGDNAYAYVGNDPFGALDPDGLLVVISGHAAAGLLGSITSPDSYHLSIVLIPDNPDDFGSGSDWRSWSHGNWGGSGVNHTIYQTIGGQPQGPSVARPPIGNLMTAINYDGDGPDASTFCQVVPTPNGMTDTEFIQTLIESAGKYSNDQRYSFPDIFFGGHMPPSWYNSNSYVAGLLADVIGSAPSLNIPGRWVSIFGVQTWVRDFQTPGYQNPLPMQ